MGNHKTAEQRAQDLERRVEWLADHPFEWEGILGAHLGPCHTTPEKVALVNKMKDAGLFSKTTAAADIDIRAYVKRAQARIRERRL